MAIAIVRLPSSVSKDSEDYKGPVFFNPGPCSAPWFFDGIDRIQTGGPGGSGVDEVVQSGAAFQQILGNQYDIIGFDPR
jgi:hypothetical protein